MEKIFRDNWISDADILSFRDRLESDLKRKNMWEQLNSISHALGTTVTV